MLLNKKIFNWNIASTSIYAINVRFDHIIA
jgi:hypothetical protein